LVRDFGWLTEYTGVVEEDVDAAVYIDAGFDCGFAVFGR